jgi:hypothetical protein
MIAEAVLVVLRSTVKEGRSRAAKLAHVPTELQGLPYEDAPKKPIYEACVIEENSRNFLSTTFPIHPSKYNIHIFISQPF